jgi:hypothetical protein
MHQQPEGLDRFRERRGLTVSPGERTESRSGTRLPRFTKYEILLGVLFLFTLPLSNPWIRGDGVGYYAFARSLLIEHRLDFTKDWQEANETFRMGRLDAEGIVNRTEYTATGHIANHFSVGPAILWSPFLIVTHAGVLICDYLGGRIPADGFSKPYRVTMAIGTALYGFLALFISFKLARRCVPECWAFLGTLGIWFASSLPVYMYFNPSWSHAHSAFMAAVFLWYWLRTRAERTRTQWLILGAIGGLMVDVYYMNTVLLLLPLLESLAGYLQGLRGAAKRPISQLVVMNVLFVLALVMAFAPTLITKKIIYGSYLNFGYTERWFWRSPAFLKAILSSDHGLFSWTPILILAVVGLFMLRRQDRVLTAYLVTVFVVFLYAMGCYQDWDGLSSFGNRFFISLTPVFVLGLASFFEWLGHAWTERRATMLCASVTGVFALWNLGLMFQWGTHLIPARGPISWREAAYNQLAVVPAQASRTLANYLAHRAKLMDQIEHEDLNQFKLNRRSP